MAKRGRRFGLIPGGKGVDQAAREKPISGDCLSVLRSETVPKRIYRTRRVCAALTGRSGLAALFVCVLLVSLVPVLLVPEESSAYSPHAPIFINGDGNFTAANGVTGGSGTAADPYRIEGWEIDASTAHGIHVQYSNASFVIRDVYVHDGGASFDGVRLLNAQNAEVENATLLSNYRGIFLYFSPNATLAGNNASSNTGTGIYLYSSPNATLTGNNASANYYGIYLYSSPDDTLTGNNASANTWGIILFSSPNATLAGNNASSNTDTGISLYSSTNALIYHNNLIGNLNQAYDDLAAENAWNDTYPVGGNFWSDYTGTDTCSGPLQNVCPDPDRLGDTPRVIDPDSQDNYPLMFPWPQVADYDPPAIEEVRINGLSSPVYPYSLPPATISLNATVNDTPTGGSRATGANYTLGPQTWPGAPMTPTTPPADAPVERFSVNLPWPGIAGSWPYCVYGIDEVGNENLMGACATLTVTDDLPPAVSGILLNGAPSQAYFISSVPSLSLTATANDTATGNSNITGANYTLGPGNWTTSQPMTLLNPPTSPIGDFAATLLLPEAGFWTYCASAADAAGNGNVSATACPGLLLTDDLPPAISAITVEPASVPAGATVWVNATLDDAGRGGSDIQNATYTVTSQIPSTALTLQNPPTSSAEDYTASFPASFPDGVYSVCVAGADVVGNVNATASCVSFSVLPDPWPPVVSAVLVDGAPSQTYPLSSLPATVTLTATVDDTTTGNAVVKNATWTLDGLFSGTSMTLLNPPSSPVEDFQATLAAPSSRGIYSLCVYGWDLLGNMGGPTCVTLVIADDIPPEIAAVQIVPSTVSVGTTSVNLTATVNDTAMGSSNATTANYTLGPGNWATSQPMTLLNPPSSPQEDFGAEIFVSSYPPGTYTFCIHASDEAGNGNLTGPCAVLTIIDPDPPTFQDVRVTPDPAELGEPGVFTTLVSDDDLVAAAYLNVTGPDSTTVEVPLVWNATSGRFEGTVPVDLIGTYTFTLEAYDRIGNRAVTTGSYTGTDSTPPTLEYPSASPDPQELGGKVIVTVRVTDRGGIASVSLEARAPNGTLVRNVSLTHLGGGAYFDNASYAALGNLTFLLRAVDESGNEANVTLLSRMQDSVPPSLAHSPITEATVGESLRMEVDVVDLGSGVDSVVLYYRGVGEQTFASVKMTPEGSRGFVAVSPALLREGPFHYYIEATDRAGNVATNPPEGEAAPHTVQVRAGNAVFPWGYALLALLVAFALLAAVFWIARRRRTKKASPPLAPKPIVTTSDSIITCGVCLGTVKKGLSIVRCGTCKKAFHDSCAARVGTCPTCETPMDMGDVEIEE